MKKHENGKDIEMTAEEVSQREADIVQFKKKSTAEDEAEAKAITEKATAQASGNTKLLGLGLTQSEATALTGYKPE
tara:strand:+ start:592 stop:819 length:228 start_codon:yes stop_codon:yes gene_type:complete